MRILNFTASKRRSLTMMYIITRIIVCWLLAGAAVAAEKTKSANAIQPSRHDFIMFVEAYSHQLKGVEPNGKCDDLAFLGKLTDKAKIIGLGESRHSAHEFLQLKRRMIECLIKKDGFTNILIEAGLSYTERLNAYIRSGTGDVNALVADMAYWSLYDNKEFIGLLDWLKEYNAGAKPGKQVSLLGIDMQDPRSAINATLAYFEQVDPTFTKKLLKQPGNLDVFGSPNVMSLAITYKKMPKRDFKDLSDKLSLMKRQLDEQRSAYMRKLSAPVYDWVYEQFATVLQAHRMYSEMRSRGFQGVFKVREKAMAENVEWQVRHGSSAAKYILLSHNNHIAKSTIYTAEPGTKTLTIDPLGERLAKDWPGRYVALATSYYEGKGRWTAWQNDAEWQLPIAGPATLDGVLAETQDKLFVIDFSDLAPGSPAAAWAGEQHPMRSEGALTKLVPSRAFDGILFVRALSQAHYTRSAIARFNQMGPAMPKAARVKEDLLLEVQGDYRLPNKSVVKFKVEDGALYAYWNQWKFHVFPLGPDRFDLRVKPRISFKFFRRQDGSVQSMQIRQGDHDWQKTKRLE